MKFAPEFYRYTGKGKTADGRDVGTGRGEKGRYLADNDLVVAVNTAVAVEQPLLVTGEAGTGKTVLAYSVAAELELGEVLLFTVRSDQRGRELLYRIDNMRRFFDAQNNREEARDLGNYVELGALGRAFDSDRRRLVLIDEIDKAPRDFPNDLLHALDEMELVISELPDRPPKKAKKRPFVVITSNRESQLPKPFLRRCVFHHIQFPNETRLNEILSERLDKDFDPDLREMIVKAFLRLRDDGLKLDKRPATGELIAWARALRQAGVQPGALEAEPGKLPLKPAVIKSREDMDKLGGSETEG